MKQWNKSKVIWMNAIAASLVVLEAKTDLLQPLLPINFYALLAALLPVINIALRCITNQGITTRKRRGARATPQRKDTPDG